MTNSIPLNRLHETVKRHAITVSGRGRTTVVLGNGFGTTQSAWSDLLPWLEARFRVVRFDWAVDTEHYDHIRYSKLDSFVEDLFDVLAESRAAPCIFIGHSLSGMVSMLAATEAPHLFSRIVMLNASPCYLNDGDYRGGFERADLSNLFQALGDNYGQWVQNFSPIVAAGLPGEPAVEEFARGLMAMRPDIALSMALTIFKADLRDRLAAFHTPTVIVQSRSDMAVPVEVGHYLHRHWPASSLELIDAPGHLPHMTAADEILAVLKRHLGPMAD